MQQVGILYVPGTIYCCMIRPIVFPRSRKTLLVEKSSNFLVGKSSNLVVGEKQQLSGGRKNRQLFGGEKQGSKPFFFTHRTDHDVQHAVDHLDPWFFVFEMLWKICVVQNPPSKHVRKSCCGIQIIQILSGKRGLVRADSIMEWGFGLPGVLNLAHLRTND